MVGWVEQSETQESGGSGCCRVSSSLNPTYVDGIAYVGSADHQLYTLDSQTGQVLWRFAADGNMTKPMIIDGVVYFGDASGYLYAVWAGVTEE